MRSHCPRLLNLEAELGIRLTKGRVLGVPKLQVSFCLSSSVDAHFLQFWPTFWHASGSREGGNRWIICSASRTGGAFKHAIFFSSSTHSNIRMELLTDNSVVSSPPDGNVWPFEFQGSLDQLENASQKEKEKSAAQCQGRWKQPRSDL